MSFITMKSALVALTASLASTATAAGAATDACSGLKAALPGSVFTQGQAGYKAVTVTYWNVGLRTDTPACIAVPTSAEEVSTFVKTMHKYPDVQFRIKSGGHDPNPGHSSIGSTGVLVAMDKMVGTKYDEEKKVAYIKPGGHWWQVLGALDGTDQTVVAGRLGIVGIGGYVTQGGVSFLSSQYGLSADNVNEFEVVQPNGTIATVNADQPELFKAMKGSGSQFGIVTQFTLRTHPIGKTPGSPGKVWGGYRLYIGEQKDKEIMAAFHKYIANYDQHKTSAVINTSSGPGVKMIFYFYDGVTPPAGTFEGLEDVQTATKFLTKTRTYANLIDTNGFGANATGQRSSFRSMTLPYLANYPTIYEDIEKDWETIKANASKHFPKGTTFIPTLAFQPFPSLIGEQSEKFGGNALGFTAQDKNRFVVEISCLWSSKGADPYVYEAQRQLTAKWVAKANALKKEKIYSNAETYTPYFANDASFDQNVFQSYNAYDSLKALQAQVDPTGLFLKNSGAFTYDQGAGTL